MRVLSIDVGIRNLAYSILELKEDGGGSISVQEWDTIDLFPTATTAARKHGISEVCRALIKALNEKVVFTTDVSDIQLVLIEDQPNYAGVTSLKAAQFYMQAFFENIAFASPSGHTPVVKLVKPVIKMKMADVLPQETRDELSDKNKNNSMSKYRRTKMMAVQVTKQFFRKSGDLSSLEQFEKLKKPDVADTICQALAYMREHYASVRKLFSSWRTQ